MDIQTYPKPSAQIIRDSILKLRANKKLRFKNAERRQTKLARGIMVAMIFTGTAMISLTSYISLELGGLCFGFFAIGLFVMFERERRRNWENASSFKIVNIETRCDGLELDITRNNHSIDSLKRNISEMSSKPIYEEQPILDMDEMNDDEDIAYELSPSSTLAANDDPFADHASLSDMVVQELVRSAVRNKRIDLFVQPIMRLPQRQPIAFEVYARIRAKAGLYVPAGRYMKMARAEQISSDIDTLMLQECLDVLRAHHGDMEKMFFFINIEAASLKNSTYMSGLLAFVAKNRELSKKLVFEMPYQDYMNLPAPISKVINGLTKLGCSFSLDHVDDLEFNLQDLIRNNVRFMKMKASWMLAQTKSDMDFTNLWRIKNKLESNGVRVIADHIENENTLRELLDYDPHYGQGYLFGKPDVIGAYPPFSYTKKTHKRKGVEEKFG